MSNDTLPLLPAPVAYGPSDDYSERTKPYYTADQLRAYAAAAVAAERARIAAPQAAPAGEPVAHLWQHDETGRTRIVMPDQIVTTDANWRVVGPLFLHAPTQAAQEPRRPMTRKEVLAIVDKQPADNRTGLPMFWRDQAFQMIRDAESFHGIKDGT